MARVSERIAKEGAYPKTRISIGSASCVKPLVQRCWPIEGAELFMALWEDTVKQLRIENNIAALAINNVDKRIKLSNELTSYCKENAGINKYILDTIIPSSVRIKETEIEHKPINILHKNSTSHHAYLSFLKELGRV